MDNLALVLPRFGKANGLDLKSMVSRGELTASRILTRRQLKDFQMLPC